MELSGEIGGKVSKLLTSLGRTIDLGESVVLGCKFGISILTKRLGSDRWLTLKNQWTLWRIPHTRHFRYLERHETALYCHAIVLHQLGVSARVGRFHSAQLV